MASSSMYSEEYFVLLLPGAEEQILSAEELTAQLKEWAISYTDALPSDVAGLADADAQAEALREGSCELEIEPGRSAQWYAIRLEK